MHRAIETRYKGYRFRSRLEARWAVFFDALGINWEYETEGFELPSGRYLPDFYLPNGVITWVEVKAGDPTPAELQKFKELCGAKRDYGLIVSGPPADQRWVHIDKRGALGDCSDWQSDTCTGSTLAHHLSTDRREFDRAAMAARGARFEHGESGAKA